MHTAQSQGRFYPRGISSTTTTTTDNFSFSKNFNVCDKMYKNLYIQQHGDFNHLNITLVDHIDTSEEVLARVGHTGGAKCRCSECQRLKDQEDKWICRLGSFNPPAGLNTRNEIKSRVRVNFRDSGRIWVNNLFKLFNHVFNLYFVSSFFPLLYPCCCVSILGMAFMLYLM